MVPVQRRKFVMHNRSITPAAVCLSHLEEGITSWLRGDFRVTTAPSYRSSERKARQPSPRPSEYTFAYSSMGVVDYLGRVAEFQNDSKNSDEESIYANAKKGNDLPFISNYQVSLGTDYIKGPLSLGVLGNWRSFQWSSGGNESAKANDIRIGKIPARWVWDLKEIGRAHV